MGKRRRSDPEFERLAREFFEDFRYMARHTNADRIDLSTETVDVFVIKDGSPSPAYDEKDPAEAAKHRRLQRLPLRETVADLMGELRDKTAKSVMDS